MITGLARKGRQFVDDPVLRRWLARRLVGREPGPPAFVPGRPPYLATLDVTGNSVPSWKGPTMPTPSPSPSNPISIPLAGEIIDLSPDTPEALFERRYDDLETELSAHRFAWVPLAGESAEPRWVAALWETWRHRYGGRTEGWPWHAYTAAERAINLIDFGRRHGLPGETPGTVALLAKHAEVIAGSLEYFGDHYTSNHLSNNGRGLLRIGCALGLPEYASLGADIMMAEADRIFGSGGTLREGSTHYHLLLTRNYLDAWAEAEASGLPQAAALGAVAKQALAAAKALRLPGGLPLIGDISPDCPPSYLATLAGTDPAAAGWPGVLDDDARARIETSIGGTETAVAADLARDGWYRFGAQDWAALTFVPSDGWPPMPGHGHQDMGGFELHFAGVPVLSDPGRGSYGETEYVAAERHNGITVDGNAAAPMNRPYYAPAFRRRVIGEPPTVTQAQDTFEIRFGGFSRLSGVGAATRKWEFSSTAVRIVDSVEGRGMHTVRRQFCTRCAVLKTPDGVEIAGEGGRFLLETGSDTTFEDVTCWQAYGAGAPGTLAVAEERVRLPYRTTTTLRRL